MAEYIDRVKLIERLHNAEENYKADHDYEVDDDPFSDGILSAMFSVNQIVGSEPTANVIKIPEGATNGDMIKAMFPDMQIDNVCNGILYGYKTNDREMPMLGMNLDWWRAPYKRGEEE